MVVVSTRNKTQNSQLPATSHHRLIDITTKVFYSLQEMVDFLPEHIAFQSFQELSKHVAESNESKCWFDSLKSRKVERITLSSTAHHYWKKKIDYRYDSLYNLIIYYFWLCFPYFVEINGFHFGRRNMNWFHFKHQNYMQYSKDWRLRVCVQA